MRQALERADRRLLRCERKLIQARAAVECLDQHHRQLLADNQVNPQPIRALFRVDGGFASQENIAWLIEMGYDVDTKARSPGVRNKLLAAVTDETVWQRVGANATLTAWAQTRLDGAFVYPVESRLGTLSHRHRFRGSRLCHAHVVVVQSVHSPQPLRMPCCQLTTRGRNAMPDTMTSRERVRRTLTFESPDRAPRDLWMLGTVPVWRGEELAGVLGRYPTDFARAPLTYRKQPEPSAGKSHEMKQVEANPLYATSPGGPRQPTPTFTGRYVDEWGCQWEVLEPGVVGEVIGPRLADWSDFANFAPPYELLDEIDLSASYPFYAQSDRFVLCSSTVEPFQRLLFLRGFENIMLDFGYEDANMRALLDMVHDFNVRQLNILAPVAADAIMFKDDLGFADQPIDLPAPVACAVQTPLREIRADHSRRRQIRLLPLRRTDLRHLPRSDRNWRGRRQLPDVLHGHRRTGAQAQRANHLLG